MLLNIVLYWVFSLKYLELIMRNLVDPTELVDIEWDCSVSMYCLVCNWLYVIRFMLP